MVIILPTTGWKSSVREFYDDQTEAARCLMGLDARFNRDLGLQTAVDANRTTDPWGGI